MVVIKTCNLGKTFANGKTALHDVNLEINKGEMIGILGHSGSGKTTLFRLLNGLATPSTGQVEIQGLNLGHISHRQLSRIRQTMALIHQQHNIVPGLSVARTVFLGRLGKLSLKEKIRALFYLKSSEVMEIYTLLEELDISSKLSQRGVDLSGGEQQRVALARALVAHPEIILADEPISSVDARTAILMLDILYRKNREDKTTILMNLHQTDAAMGYCSRILGFNQGRLVYDGPPSGVPLEQIYKAGTGAAGTVACG